MIEKVNYFFYFLIIIVPITLITGPAIPDLTIFFSCIFFLYLFIIKKQFKEILSQQFFYISIFFWIFLLFISLFAEDKILAYRDSIIFIRILLIPIFLYYWIFSNDKNLRKIITIIFYSVIFVCIDCIFQFTNYQPEYGFGSDLFGFKPDFYGRLTGPFKNELIPGSYISKFSLIGLIFILIKFKNIFFQNLLIILYLSLVGTVCYISGERMALATYLLGLCFLLVFFNDKRISILISLILIFLFSFIINKTHPIYNDYKIIESTPYHLGLKVEKEFNCENNNSQKCKKIIKLQPEFSKILNNFDESAYGQIYKLSLQMWKDHPLQGIGMNNFTKLCNEDIRYKNLIKNYDCTTHPHNFYLQWMVETGIFGLFLFLIYLLFLFRFVLVNNFNKFSIISLATLIILFWPIMSTGSLLKNWMGVSTFFIIGICISLNKLNKKFDKFI